jgi:hypothetical protein
VARTRFHGPRPCDANASNRRRRGAAATPARPRESEGDVCTRTRTCPSQCPPRMSCLLCSALERNVLLLRLEAGASGGGARSHRNARSHGICAKIRASLGRCMNQPTAPPKIGKWIDDSQCEVRGCKFYFISFIQRKMYKKKTLWGSRSRILCRLRYLPALTHLLRC